MKVQMFLLDVVEVYIHKNNILKISLCDALQVRQLAGHPWKTSNTF